MEVINVPGCQHNGLYRYPAIEQDDIPISFMNPDEMPGTESPDILPYVTQAKLPANMTDVAIR